MGILNRDRKRRPDWMRAIIRAGYAWVGLAVVGSISQSDFQSFSWIVFVLHAFFAVTSPVMAVSAIFLGHRPGSRKPNATGRDLDADRGMAAVVLGHLWWFAVWMYMARGPVGFAWFALTFVLIESPRIIFEGGRGNRCLLLGAILVLGAVTAVSFVGEADALTLAGFIGTLELTILAGWWPFRAHRALTDRTRILVAGMLYLFAVLALVGLYLHLWRPSVR